MLRWWPHLSKPADVMRNLLRYVFVFKALPQPVFSTFHLWMESVKILDYSQLILFVCIWTKSSQLKMVLDLWLKLLAFYLNDLVFDMLKGSLTLCPSQVLCSDRCEWPFAFFQTHRRYQSFPYACVGVGGKNEVCSITFDQKNLNVIFQNWRALIADWPGMCQSYVGNLRASSFWARVGH